METFEPTTKVSECEAFLFTLQETNFFSLQSQVLTPYTEEFDKSPLPLQYATVWIWS